MTDARRALLSELIDHAPLFPPASLPLDEALEDHRRARSSPHAWMVKRFVAPASRLAELDGEELRLSVVADGSVPADERIEAVEGTAVEPRRGIETYIEVPPGNTSLARLAATGARAKVRCSPAPPVEELAGFVRACREQGVVFKATAGLHHAVRTDSEHGLVNVLAAVVFGDEENALAESDPAAFGLDASGFRWRDRTAGAEELAAARIRFASVGSCSFTEPVEDLERLGLL